MRAIERSSMFKRDYKHVKAMPHYSKNLDSLITKILECLLADKALPERNCDHALSGIWKGYRECHIKPDLLLIYKKLNSSVLRLARLGSHSELFD